MDWEPASQGKHGARRRSKRRGCLIAAVAVLLLVVVIAVVSRCSGGDEYGDLSWPTSGLATMLPEPPSDKGEVTIDSEDMFSATIGDVTDEEGTAYMDACEEKGFTVDVERDESRFEAYAESGERLVVTQYSEGELNIDLYAAVEMGPIAWPTAGPGALLPAPPSLTGHVNGDSSTRYSVTIGEMTQEQFVAYADACFAAGFSVDYSKGDTVFSADNGAGASVHITWDGGGMMSIGVDVDQQEAATTPEAQTDPAPESTPAPETPSTQTGVSADFKQTVDSYEAFFNEYADFMEEYSSSGNPASMALQYASMMAQYTDYMAKLSALDDGTLSADDYAYLMDAQVRINQRLAGIAG